MAKIDDEDEENEDLDKTPAREKSDAALIKDKSPTRNSDLVSQKGLDNYETKKVDDEARINGTDEVGDDLDFI